ncbi:DUF401 family protein [Natranaerobius thermophilus]|uniref:DUF401 family protein n=1 Tax=Natranaerobius thermophilus (strain ATCC BAA-1301 / DSM 18059 / JW/NM-WN-LF) TaxID=457570 RepID=B2A5W9_NATTJ|nr:DUF401 family protein [Natranaerobius thermophilus]ACB84062.1 protein of unknown function DUF401 [Natranaerobius thermophilus JW/NM-WN-LF]
MEILGVFIAIITIIYLVRKNKHLGGAMTLGALIVAIFSGMTLPEKADTLFYSVTHPTTVNIMLIVLMINIFSTMLKKTNSLDIMLNSLTKLLPDRRILLVTIPSLIGMLTVPGGAVLSAPMIQNAGDQINLSKAKLAAANMFYRHVWHLIFPLIPSIILISELSQVPLRFFILFNLPIFLVTFIIGFKWLFRNHRHSFYSHEESSQSYQTTQNYDSDEENNNLIAFLKSIYPLILAVGLGIFSPLDIPVSLLIGVLLASLNYLDWNEKPVIQIRNRIIYSIKQSKYGMVLTILGIMIFKDFVEASGAVETMTESLLASGIPSIFLVLLVPLITAAITGVNSAALGISYPIMAPLMNPHDGNLALLGIFYAASVFGYFLSPFHLCLILTKEYFQTTFNSLYRELILPASFMLIGGIIVGVFWGVLS